MESAQRLARDTQERSAVTGRGAVDVLERFRAAASDVETGRDLLHAITDQSEPLAFAGSRTAQ